MLFIPAAMLSRRCPQSRGDGPSLRGVYSRLCGTTATPLRVIVLGWVMAVQPNSTRTAGGGWASLTLSPSKLSNGGFANVATCFGSIGPALTRPSPGPTRRRPPRALAYVGGRRYLQSGWALYRPLTGGSKCDYIKALARLPPPARFPGCAVGNEAAGRTGGFARFRPLYGWCSVAVARVKLRRPCLRANKGCASSATAMAGSRLSKTTRSAGWPAAMP